MDVRKLGDMLNEQIRRHQEFTATEPTFLIVTRSMWDASLQNTSPVNVEIFRRWFLYEKGSWSFMGYPISIIEVPNR